MATTTPRAVRSLGELGTENEPIDITFQWFGVTIRVAENAGDASLIDFLEVAARIPTKDRVSAMQATTAFLKEQIDPRDWPTFLRLCKEHRQGWRDMLRCARDICEAITNFRTTPPLDSSDGRASTPTKSGDDYSSAVERSMVRLKGRADLKMQVWNAYQAIMAERAEVAA